MGNTDQPNQSDNYHSGPVAHEGLYQEASAAYHNIGNFMACAVCSHLLNYQVNLIESYFGGDLLSPDLACKAAGGMKEDSRNV